MELGGQRYSPAALPPGKTGTHCSGGWVGSRAGLEGCGNSRPRQHSIPKPSSPLRVAMSTTVSRPRNEL